MNFACKSQLGVGCHFTEHSCEKLVPYLIYGPSRWLFFGEKVDTDWFIEGHSSKSRWLSRIPQNTFVIATATYISVTKKETAHQGYKEKYS